MRKKDGRFAKGHSGNPGGGPKGRGDYLKRMSQVVSVDDWEAITLKAVAQAKKGDKWARDWLSAYLIGKPSTVSIEGEPGEGGHLIEFRVISAKSEVIDG